MQNRFLEEILQFHANSKSSFSKREHTNGRREEEKNRLVAIFW